MPKVKTVIVSVEKLREIENELKIILRELRKMRGAIYE